jgi:hypothetical protein
MVSKSLYSIWWNTQYSTHKASESYKYSSVLLFITSKKKAGTVQNAYLLFILYAVFIVQAYQTSQYVVPRGGIFLSKWRSSFARSSR